MYPADFRYTKDHEWIKLDGAVGTVGITDYAQQELGDVVFVSGEIAEINSALVNAPEKINKDPQGSAWLVKIRLSDPKEALSLMDAVAYEAYVSTQAKGH